jgi:hypothetical protein
VGKPILCISAVSKELRSARQLVANTVTFVGYEPGWQDVFGTGDGDLRDMLRRRIDASRGVVQIVGRGARRWATLVAVLLVAGTALGIRIVHRQGRASDQLADAVAAIPAMRAGPARFQEVAPDRFQQLASGRTHGIPAAAAAELDREQAAIDEESAQLDAAADAWNRAVAELDSRLAGGPPPDEITLQACNAQAERLNALRAQLEDRVRQHNARVDAFDARMATAGAAVR